jgi:hypothetical protein
MWAKSTGIEGKERAVVRLMRGVHVVVPRVTDVWAI